MVTIPPRKNKVPNILGDWDDVRFFLAVAKTGSFSAAATQLNTKQTTVGRRIQALERRLGAKLFDRHRHGMEVTPAARGVLAQAESMMSNATAIERHLAGLDREMAGIVRIAATEGLGHECRGAGAQEVEAGEDHVEGHRACRQSAEKGRIAELADNSGADKPDEGRRQIGQRHRHGDRQHRAVGDGKRHGAALWRCVFQRKSSRLAKSP